MPNTTGRRSLSRKPATTKAERPGPELSGRRLSAMQQQGRCESVGELIVASLNLDADRRRSALNREHVRGGMDDARRWRGAEPQAQVGVRSNVVYGDERFKRWQADRCVGDEARRFWSGEFEVVPWDRALDGSRRRAIDTRPHVVRSKSDRFTVSMGYQLETVANGREPVREQGACRKTKLRRGSSVVVVDRHCVGVDHGDQCDGGEFAALVKEVNFNGSDRPARVAHGRGRERRTARYRPNNLKMHRARGTIRGAVACDCEQPGSDCTAIHGTPVAVEMLTELETPLIIIRGRTTEKPPYGAQDRARDVRLTHRHRNLPVRRAQFAASNRWALPQGRDLPPRPPHESPGPSARTGDGSGAFRGTH
jgi:hypothetical protein